MDKLEVLKEFERVAEGVGLGSDEFRLFLLLLAVSDRNSGCGVIEASAVSVALGAGRDPAPVPAALDRLAALGLVCLFPGPPDKGTNEETRLNYTIPLFRRGRCGGEESWNG